MNRRPSGFTMIELVFAIMIGSILTSIALSSFQDAQSAFAVRNAKSMYATLHQRARAKAIEMGETVLFAVDLEGDSAFIASLTNGPEITDVTRFRSQLDVDLRGRSSYILCMTPRGYADVNCGAFAGIFTNWFDSPQRLEFWQAGDSASLVVLPMGQLVGLR